MIKGTIIDYLTERFGGHEQDPFGWFDFPANTNRKFSYLNTEQFYSRDGKIDTYKNKFILRLL